MERFAFRPMKHANKQPGKEKVNIFRLLSSRLVAPKGRQCSRSDTFAGSSVPSKHPNWFYGCQRPPHTFHRSRLVLVFASLPEQGTRISNSTQNLAWRRMNPSFYLGTTSTPYLRLEKVLPDENAKTVEG